MNWIASDTENAKYLGPILIADNEIFEILQARQQGEEKKPRLVFGGVCNTGFIESGYMEIENDETIDEALYELFSELEQYYIDPKGCNRIVYNERM